MTHFFQNILDTQGLKSLFEFSKKQSILGYVWDELQAELSSCPEKQDALNSREDRALLARWYTVVSKIEEVNKQQNILCGRIEQKFMSDGFQTQILKGQSLAPLHRNPLHRSPGDIDIWLRKKDGNNRNLAENRDCVVKYIRKIMPNSKIYYHHMELPSIGKTSVEAHFTPSWMANPFRNRELQQFFIQEFKSSKVQEFNEVFIPLHIFRHLFQEGISLKQVLDYYYVLRHRAASGEDAASAVDMLRRLGLIKFIRALLWIEQEVFGLEKALVFLESDEKEGRFLLKEILSRGRGDASVTISDFTSDSHLHNFGSRIKRAVVLLGHCPDEALWEVPWRVWHWIWRRCKGYV